MTLSRAGLSLPCQGATMRDNVSCKSQVPCKLFKLVATIICVATVCTIIAAEASIDKWAFSIPGGSSQADKVAAESGCKNLGLVNGLDDIYLFEKRADAMTVHRERRALEAHPFVEPQIVQKRVKRDAFQPGKLTKKLKSRRGEKLTSDDHIVSSSAGRIVPGMQHVGWSHTLRKPFNDELWNHQWYLQDQADVSRPLDEMNLRVEDVWRMGYTGAGVVVTIMDNGLERNHTDIAANYDPQASWDYVNNQEHPSPTYDRANSNSHGTRNAGVVAMVANNRKCGVGIAPRARIGGLKVFDGIKAGEVNSEAFIHNIDYIDIYSASWGPPDNGMTLGGPKWLAAQAIKRGVELGRKGKGALYVWATGNGFFYDNCNCDGYVTSIYTISIGAATQQGQFPTYAERCSSMLAVATSSGATTDGRVVTTDLHNTCTIDYTGTSAAAPLAAGIYALALEANGNLTWRDVQHLTAWTSNPIPLRNNPGWKRNGAGLIFNSRFGFGLLNAKAMVDAAIGWRTVPRKYICDVTPSGGMPVFLQSGREVQRIFETNGCLHRAKQMGANRAKPVIYLEHVQLVINLNYTVRGAVEIFLKSPSGTVSTLLTHRPQDTSRDGFDKWPLMSVHFWGEVSIGTWTLIVRDKDGRNNRGLLRNAVLKLHGTSERPLHALQARRYEGESEVQPFMDPAQEQDDFDIYVANGYPDDDDSYQMSGSRSSQLWHSPP